MASAALFWRFRRVGWLRTCGLKARVSSKADFGRNCRMRLFVERGANDGFFGRQVIAE
ncbi:hypothetical protein [Bradyrhizobium sp.]|uniref:hypothetical protein n=1 Tax=Bradyrhizobium sp. TaxID=376 RepID=UPI003C767609